MQLSESFDEESAAIEAEFARANQEELGEGLDALEPDLDELPKPNVARQSPVYDENDENHTRVAVMAKLVIVEGPDAKRDVPFVGIRMLLGRAPNLEVSLTDAAVSRRHAEFVRGDNGVLLRDLGSGNGTLVNGQPVTEQILSHNDLIVVGATKLRYINEAEAHAKSEPTSIRVAPIESDSSPALPEEKEPSQVDVPEQALVRQAPPSSVVRREKRSLLHKNKRAKLWENPQKKKQLIWIASGAGVVLCLLMVVFLARGKKPPTPEPVVIPVSAENYMSQAREAVRQGRYDEALALRAQALTIDANIDSSNLGLQIDVEIEAQKKLREVTELTARKEFSLAKELLDKIPDASARSDEAKKKMLERIVKEEQQFHLQRAEELLMLGEFDSALDALRPLPRPMQTQIGGKIEVGRASYDEAKRQERVVAKTVTMTAQKVREEARKQQLAVAFAEVQRKFNTEDWKRAADECDRTIVQHPGDAEIRKRAKELQRMIPEFGQAYDEGARKYRAGQIAASAVPLAKARAIYLKIGFPSAVDGSLREMLSQASLLAGEDALARGNYAAAADHFSEALKMQPSSERAKKGLARVADKAEDLFAMGYSMRSTNPREARRYFEMIIKITPRGSHWYERAQNQMNAMSFH